MIRKLAIAVWTCLQLGVLPMSAADLRRPAGFDGSLGIRLYDYAELEAGTLEAAKVELDEIFARVGIGVSWLLCPKTMEEARTNLACRTPTLATDLILRLLPPAMHPETSRRSDPFGLALIGPELAVPRTASIFVHNVERLGERRLERLDYSVVHRSFSDRVFLGRLLGYVMAHEIGHLLLRSGDHSQGGIMRGRWDVHVTKRALARRLRFRADEVAGIQAEVRRRAAVAQSQAALQMR